MKQFFKYVLATMVGIVIMWILASLLGFALLGALVASGSAEPPLENNSVLKISLSGTIVERAQNNPLAKFSGGNTGQKQGLDDIIKAIKEAKNNKKIKGIYLEAGDLATDYAVVQELRGVLKDFKSSKKFIVAYGDSYSQQAYYVGSVADKVFINPSGLLEWQGIASQPIFFKDLLDKVGVKMQIFKVGTYKSAVEPYTNTAMSEANREQVTSYISGIWKYVVNDVAESRQIPTDSLNAYADSYISLKQAEEYKQKKLVDELVYIDELRADLRKRLGDKEVHFISAENLAKVYKEDEGKERIAVYYAEGDIVDEGSNNPMAAGAEIIGSKVVEDLDKLASDEKVKAVVLRINSGGGSAYASEQMWRAVELLKKKKPVVVSMSGLAASGGYYMSCGANYIIAEPTTLTGSIGIFGMVPDASGLMKEKLGLHFDVVKTNESADFGAMGRSFNAAESAAMQAYVEKGYAQFLSRVAQGRGKTTEEVDKIAQGRVWTGEEALKIKLVDQLGTLDDAIKKAAELAKVKTYGIVTSPEPASFFDKFLKDQTDDYMERKLRLFLGEYYRPLSFISQINQRNMLQARIFFDPNVR